MDIKPSKSYIIRNTSLEEKKKYIGIISTEESLMDQCQIIRNWKPLSDVWPLRFGRTILIGAATMTGMYINHRFRAKLKFRDFGVFPTMLGLSLSPAITTALTHTQFVLNKILLFEMSCPLCMESRSALAQTFSGLFMPLIVTPFANFSIAAGSGVYNTPYITDVRKIVSTIWSVYKPMAPKLALLFAFHALLAGFITYLEIKSFLRIIDLQYLITEEKERRSKTGNIL